MTKKKGTAIVAGLVIAGLVGSNAYAYMELNKEKDVNKEEAHKLEEQREQLNVTISQIMGKSTEFVSHDDMIYAFNMYASSNRIHYNGADYYADINDIQAHSFNKNEKVKYEAEANMTFLKDKKVNEMSYIQNELPVKVMEEAKKVAEQANEESGEETDSHEGHEGEEGHDHEHDIVIPQESMTDIEKKEKKEFIVAEWNQELTFNMDGAYIMQPTSDMEESIVKEFIKTVVLKDKDVNGNNAKIQVETQDIIQTIHANVDGKAFDFTYNKDTKELKEKK
ncbi:hypothetical protein CVD28_24420 [Bacillus sp. M6-12]|uniref:hypothetical protein n=1 Tax=Bacillus sp. M6-12 TaxID=2054166 RepID=UPI000C7626D6|nr:hypothetical protein [Bacillus sp. M6-12]PLS15028.1 hypothetical protein CVD28_24420 [Bacillus sp. M6-12]